MQDTATETLSDGQMLRLIHGTPSMERVWKKLDTDLKRKALYLAQGEAEFLPLVLEDMEEEVNERGH